MPSSRSGGSDRPERLDASKVSKHPTAAWGRVVAEARCFVELLAVEPLYGLDRWRARVLELARGREQGSDFGLDL